MGIAKLRALSLVGAALMCLGAVDVQAQTVSNPVVDNGKLVMSTTSTTTDNQLAPAPSSFSFSDSFSGVSSSNGFWYADYLVTVLSATAQSVTTTLTNSGGVANLSERIYAYSGSFLGDASAPSGALQVWSTNYPLPGASVSIVSPTNLTTGQYVVELRGTSAGVFAGTLSLSPVPEPEGVVLALAGLGALVAATRKKTNRQA